MAESKPMGGAQADGRDGLRGKTFRKVANRKELNRHFQLIGQSQSSPKQSTGANQIILIQTIIKKY